MNDSDNPGSGARLSEDHRAHQRVIWRSRRGMLELDLLLAPFAAANYPQLAAEEQANFQHLLACEDQDLYRWLVKRVPVDDPAMQAIVACVLQAKRSGETGTVG